MTTPPLLYLGPQYDDGLGRIHHLFRSEVLGRIAEVLVPIPQTVEITDEIRHQATETAAASFAQLELSELAKLRNA